MTTRASRRRIASLKIATFNINNIRARLPNLLAWLSSAKPDVVCLQELKTAHEVFPLAAIEAAGYGAVWKGEKTWNGVAILAKGAEPLITRTALPGDPADRQSRYIEAAIAGILIGCLYAPNGNPQPGPKFKYKLAWLARAGCTLPEIAAITGHSLRSIHNVLKHYLAITPELADSAITKLVAWMDREDGCMSEDAKKPGLRLVCEVPAGSRLKVDPQGRVIVASPGLPLRYVEGDTLRPWPPIGEAASAAPPRGISGN